MSETDGRVYAGFWLRLVASILDDIIVSITSLVLAYGALYLIYLVAPPAPSFGESFKGGFIQMVNLGAMVFIGFPYYIAFHWKMGATPGKMALKIRVIMDRDSGPLSFKISLLRYSCQFLSALPFGAGYVMAMFSEKRQALHDRIAGTVSVILK